MATKLKKLLGKEAYWTINKDLSRKIGLEQTLVLQHIIDLTESAFKRDEIFQPISEMKDELGLTEFSVKKAVKELAERNFINVVRKGIPFKNYYSVNERTILEFIFAPTIEVDSTQYSETTESPNYSDENDITIEVNTTQQQGENTVANTNNTNKEYETNNIKTNNTDTDSTAFLNSHYNFCENLFNEINSVQIKMQS
jgi:hypothetical protein